MMATARRRSLAVALTAQLALTAAACGSDGDSQASNASQHDSGDAQSHADGPTQPEASIAIDSPTSDVQADACAASKLEAALRRRPVDVILVVDTSSTMNPASSAVEATINDNLAAVLLASNVDYRVILLAGYGSGSAVCIAPPLGGAPCAPTPPDKPAQTATFFQYPAQTGSGNFLSNIISWYGAQDPLGVAPSGYSAWLRADALKVFIALTDTSSNSSMSGAEFDQALLALSPAQFGTEQERNYVFHSIIGLKENAPPTSPWLPGDPIVDDTCSGYSGSLGSGKALQQVSILSGGLRFPMCQFGAFDVVFKTLSEEVIDVAPIACELPFPEPAAGQTLNPDTIQLEYTPGGGTTRVLKQVADPSQCNADSFYVADDQIHLCPDACEIIQKDPEAAVDVRFGCDVGFAK